MRKTATITDHPAENVNVLTKFHGDDRQKFHLKSWFQPHGGVRREVKGLLKVRGFQV